MFEKATIIFPGTTDGNLNIGRILDAMLYYQSIEFIVDGRSFIHLWNKFGPDDMLALLKHPSLDSKLTPEMPAIYNENVNGITSHRPVQMSRSGRDGFPIDDKDTASKLAFSLGESEFRNNQPVVNKITKQIRETRFSKIFSELPISGDLFKDLISDTDTMKLFIESYANKESIPINYDLLNSLQVEVIETQKGYVILSNIHPSAIVSGHFEEGWQNLLPMIHDYQLDLRMAQTRSADIIFGDVSAHVSSKRLDISINRALQADKCRSAFEEFAFSKARPFGQAFENGQLSLSDALKVVDQTSKFREWLAGVPVDKDLVREFHLAVSKETILDKLPGRTSRFAVFTGTGAVLDMFATGGIATVASLGLSAFDSFVLDGLIKGWKPSNFVEKVESALGP